MANSRTNDPFTSYVAAREVEASGTAKAQRESCLGVVKQNPGGTAAEIAVRCGHERHAPSRWWPELRRAGQVINGEFAASPSALA